MTEWGRTELSWPRNSLELYWSSQPCLSSPSSSEEPICAVAGWRPRS